jgi:hypothetical protein
MTFHWFFCVYEETEGHDSIAACCSNFQESQKSFKYCNLTACLELACPERLQLYKMIKADIVDIVAQLYVQQLIYDS